MKATMQAAPGARRPGGSPERRLPLGLLALAAGGFGIGLTEFVIAGLLPEVAADFGVSEPTAGWLISGYALAVAVGAIVVTAAVTRFDRKHVLLGLTVLFVIGNLLSAIATDFGVMLLGRIVAALNHGAFFGIGSVVAASLVEPARKAAAIAMMFAGLTVANVLGVPLGTLVGQQFGWRAAFWCITVIGILTFVAIAAAVPSRPSDRSGSIWREFAVFRSGQVWLTMAVTILGFGGMFGAFTYIAFVLTDLAGFSAGAVPWLLMIFGAGLFAGNLLGGRGADRNPDRTLVAALLALVLVLVLFTLTAHIQVLALVWLITMGFFAFATVPGLQMRIMQFAGRAPTLASGANIAAFNLGNAIGAWLGGLGISIGWGYRSPIGIGAALSAGGLLVLLVAIRRSRAASRPGSGETREERPLERRPVGCDRH